MNRSVAESKNVNVLNVCFIDGGSDFNYHMDYIG